MVYGKFVDLILEEMGLVKRMKTPFGFLEHY